MAEFNGGNQEQLSRRREVQTKDIIVVVIVVTVTLALVISSYMYIGGADTNTTFNMRYSDYNEGWDLVLDGESTPVDLPAHVRADKDGQVILRRTLPETLEPYSAIIFRTYHQKTEVRIGDQQRFRYPSKDRNINFSCRRFISRHAPR